MVRSHQPGEANFRSILPEDIDWKPFPAFPPAVRLAVLIGDPTQPGPYVIRVKVPSGVKMMPHQHPEDRIYTVMSGVFYIGLGDQFDGEKVKAYPPGCVVVLPGDTPHFHWAKHQPGRPPSRSCGHVLHARSAWLADKGFATCRRLHRRATHPSRSIPLPIKAAKIAVMMET